MLIAAFMAAAGLIFLYTGGSEDEAARDITTEEAQLLSQVRTNNHGSEPMAFRMKVPTPEKEIILDGYVDWTVPFIYSRYDFDGDTRLLQAIPGLVAHGPDHEAFERAAVSQEGWGVRPILPGDNYGLTRTETDLDVLISSLFTLTATEEDNPVFLQQEATWQGTEAIDGVDVDVFQAPIMVEGDTQMGVPDARYSVDGSGQLRRFEVNLGFEENARIDFLLEKTVDSAELVPIDLLGGPAGEAQSMDEELATTVSQIRSSNRWSTAGFEFTVPQPTGELLTGKGQINWGNMTAYSAVSDGDGHRLEIVKPGGFTTRKHGSDSLAFPVPASDWQTIAAGSDEAQAEFGPVEALLYRLLDMAADSPDDPERLVEHGVVLREYEQEGEPVYVVEYPIQGDEPTEPGQAAFRYHISQNELTVIEMNTETGMARLDLDRSQDVSNLNPPWEVTSVIG